MGVTPFEDAVISMENQAALKFPNLYITWPEDSIADASSSAEAIEGKIGTISHGVIALLLAFLILISLRKKESHQQFSLRVKSNRYPAKCARKRNSFGVLDPDNSGVGNFSGTLPFGESTSRFIGFSLWNVGALPPLADLSISTFNIHLHSRWMHIVGRSLLGLRVWAPFGLAATFATVFLLLDSQRGDQDWRLPAIGAICTIGIAALLTKLLSKWWKKYDRSTFLIVREDMLMWQSVAAILAFTIFLASLTISFNSGVNKEIDTQARDSIPLNLIVSPSDQLLNPLELGGPQDFEGPKLFQY
ncbi:MAG: hypothetical protein WDO06_07660 [Actinomycetota bacterium]